MPWPTKLEAKPPKAKVGGKKGSVKNLQGFCQKSFVTFDKPLVFDKSLVFDKRTILVFDKKTILAFDKRAHTKASSCWPGTHNPTSGGFPLPKILKGSLGLEVV